jgi:hypothetical protein
MLGGALLTNGSAVGTIGGAAVGGIIGHEVSKPKWWGLCGAPDQLADVLHRGGDAPRGSASSAPTTDLDVLSAGDVRMAKA